ncbi:hypothetical protein CABS01_03319 [Colletotrichum abscissum]|uniref:Uncharacterized protein n=1 Tax=Colletotrichum cuscutae TaxID=1209917 RepID=A0AAI9XND7_9PEZI|nr:uncharacterized protein CABS01_03319 [Colletotrichum abscissum]KAK1454267.1 hypothetical protein CCUS01_10560 [Colletotrichum cuscutae]KAK1478017.1 hypothetical protein CABS01_03319 [Colletotrichum abscissum]
MVHPTSKPRLLRGAGPCLPLVSILASRVTCR